VDETVFRPASPLALARSGDPYRTESDRQDWSWATPALWRRGTVLNLDPDFGDFSRLASVRRLSGYAARAESGAIFFGGISLRFGIRYRDQPPLPGFRRFGGDAVRDWDENPDALPDLRLVERWREECGALGALQALPRLSEGEIVVETGRATSGAARKGQLTVLEKSPERLILATECPDPTWLFVLRGFWTHRSILVDGERARAVPSQLAFSAVALSAGGHRVEWREEIPGLTVSRWGPALFALFSAGLLVRKPAEGSRA
jgi:hypothetical protein